MTRLLVRNARAVTIGSPGVARRGPELGAPNVLPAADISIEDGTIQSVTPHDPAAAVPAAEEIIAADGRVVLPGFVDCHTHACFAGNRLDEWEQKLSGATYLEILQTGGGIMSTVRAVRAASQEELSALLLERLNAMLQIGTTCVEVKSGYGLTTDDELKMLRAIADAGSKWAGQVAPTACLGHALDPDVDRDEFLRRTIGETLPAVSAEFPGIAVDAYCEEGAWTVDECRRLFTAAAERGHPIRVHADQFHALGMVDVAISDGYRSVDHLEASDNAELARLAGSDTFGVMLPACGFHVDHRYADGRGFVDAGGALALATNFNPGSAPCYSIPAVMALAVRHLGLSVAESITACTVNAATLLGCTDRGTIAAGQPADLVLLAHRDERMLGFEFGDNPVDAVVCGGRLQ